MINKQAIIEAFKEVLNQEKDHKKLHEVKNIFVTKNIIPLLSNIKDLAHDQRKDYGILVNQLKNEIQDVFNNHYESINGDNSYHAQYSPIIEAFGFVEGGINLIDKTILEIVDFFNKIGFDLINGDELVSTKHNFEWLNINQDHPARDEHDSFYVDSLNLLRSHCTAATAKFMKNDKRDEIKIISTGNVYRKDEDDATHSHQFNQIDLVWLRKDLSIKNLKWIVNEFLASIFKIKNLKTRYRLSHFPFTEPSFEVDISCFKCQAKGCNICKQSGWIEILGAGIFHPNVIQAIGADEKMIGLAFGLGIDRIVMLKYGISDIRYLYNNDFRLLKQFKSNY